MPHEKSWQQNFELLKANIEEHHHFPDKMVRLFRPAQEPAHQPRAISGSDEYEGYERALWRKTEI